MDRSSRPRRILADADALVALVKRDDTNHEKATNLAKQAHERGAEFYISQYTVAEVCTVLSNKVSHQVAVEFLASVHEKNITVIGATETVFLEAEKVFVEQHKKGTSYFDCVNIALFRQLGFDQMFSFDGMYAKNGVAVYGVH